MTADSTHEQQRQNIKFETYRELAIQGFAGALDKPDPAKPAQFDTPYSMRYGWQSRDEAQKTRRKIDIVVLDKEQGIAMRLADLDIKGVTEELPVIEKLTEEISADGRRELDTNAEGVSTYLEETGTRLELFGIYLPDRSISVRKEAIFQLDDEQKGLGKQEPIKEGNKDGGEGGRKRYRGKERTG